MQCGTSFGLVVENYGCIPSEDGEAGAGASTAATADDAGTDKTTAAAEATARVYNIHTQKVERHRLSGECACSEPKHWDQLLRARRKQALTCAPDVTLHGPMLGHNLLPPELDRSAVALFREPSSRLVSAFDHGGGGLYMSRSIFSAGSLIMFPLPRSAPLWAECHAVAIDPRC